MSKNACRLNWARCMLSGYVAAMTNAFGIALDSAEASSVQFTMDR
jgi:hypothetical protein